nr:MAG TPA: hypothetical protein [Caudoviricetes sp.]
MQAKWGVKALFGLFLFGIFKKTDYLCTHNELICRL